MAFLDDRGSRERPEEEQELSLLFLCPYLILFGVTSITLLLVVSSIALKDVFPGGKGTLS